MWHMILRKKQYTYLTRRLEENFPKKDSMFPALVIELKWNKDADTAIKQIHDRKYPEALKGFCGEVILVGVNYDKDAEPGKRKHSCKIEKITL